MDKVQSIYQGRPTRLRERDSRVPLQFLDEYDELEPFSTLTYSAVPRPMDCPTYSISAFQQLCKISTIMDRILYSLYSAQSASQDPVGLYHTSEALLDDLRGWRESLPSHLSIKLDRPEQATSLPHTLSLQ